MPHIEGFTYPRVEITRNIPVWVISDSGGGRRIMLSKVFEPVFYVTVFEDDGEFVIWDGADYEGAIITAEEVAQDWGVFVWDRVAERAFERLSAPLEPFRFHGLLQSTCQNIKFPMAGQSRERQRQEQG